MQCLECERGEREFDLVSERQPVHFPQNGCDAFTQSHLRSAWLLHSVLTAIADTGCVSRGSIPFSDLGAIKFTKISVAVTA